MHPFRQAPLHPRALLLAAALLSVLPSLATARELVRVKISAFSGREGFAVDSVSHPELFVLDDAVDSVVLVATNPFLPSKTPSQPARFFANLTPVPPASQAGAMDLIVTPKDNTALAPDLLRFTAQAAVVNNPSGLAVTWSRDGFASVLDLVALEEQHTRNLRLVAPPSQKQLVVRFTATNDFGTNGGGDSGFADLDMVLSEGGCPPAPAFDCLEPGKASVRIVQGVTPDKNAIDWTWAKGTVSSADFGDPTAGTGYAVCIYDDGILSTSSEIPPGGICRGRPCWRASKRGGFGYNDRDGRADGILRATLKPGDANALVKVTARAPQVPLGLPYSQGFDVTVQLHRTDGAGCWNATFTAPSRVLQPTALVDTLP